MTSAIFSRWLPCGVALVALWPVSAFAQVVAFQSPTDLKRMSVAELLQQKVISVTRRPDTLGQSPSSVFLITGAAVDGSRADTLPQVLRLAPNLFVAQASSYDWAVGARGFTRANSRVNKMQVLMDGRVVYSPLFSGVFWGSQDVFLPDLDRIEVISGPAGVTWGANAVNGVINITTKSAKDTQGALVYGGFGNELIYTAGMRYGGQLGSQTHYRVYVKSRSFDDTLAANGIDSGLDQWDFTQTGFRIDSGDAGSESNWTLQGDAYRGNYQDPGLAGLPALTEGANVMARWTRRYSEESNMVFQLYHDYTRRDQTGIFGETLRTTDFEFQHRFAAGPRHDLVWGARYRYLNESVDNWEGVLAFLPPKVNLHVGGIFAQDEMDLIEDRLRLFAGLRFENNSYSGWEVQPNVRIAWTVQPEHTLWAAISRATRTPSRIDGDFFVPSDEPFVLTSDSDIQSENLIAYEVGWRGQLTDGIAASFTTYYHDFDRLRSLEPGPPILITNGLKGHSYGAEFFLDWQAAEWWRFRFGGFLLEEETSFRPGGADIEGGLGEASNPGYQFLLRSGFDLTDDLLLWLAFRSIGEVPAYAGGVDAGSVPAYTELDATLSWTLRPGLEWSLVGRNLLHSSHPEIGESALNRREIQRSVHTMIQWEF